MSLTADPSTHPDEDPLVGTLIGERYRLAGVLGSGGMGTVYLAEHVLMEKKVALKVLHPSLAVLGSVMDRFQKEAVALARIEHPNVVSATDFGKLDNGSYYLALQYIEGRSLFDVLAAEGAFKIERALSITAQILSALVTAHAQGIVHRDLKPHNVMLAVGSDGSEQVKVLDFGLAKLRSRSGPEPATSSGTVIGTPHYMSPEQIAGNDVDGRADLYSVGVILFEMLTGTRPFQADDVRELLGKHVTEAPPDLPETFPIELRLCVAMALEKDPRTRYKSASEMFHAVSAILHPTVEVRAPVQWHTRSLTLLGVKIPIWGLFLPLGVFLIPVGVKALWPQLDPSDSTHSRSEAALAAALENLPPPPDRWPALRSEAEFGNQAAIEELMRILPGNRDRDVWLVLGRGHMLQKRTAKALELYRQAIHHLPELAENETIAKHVRLATLDKTTAKEAVVVAAESLGTRGVDILFSVWGSTSKRTPASALAERYMAEQRVRAKASPQVKLALDLRNVAELDCEGVLALVSKAASYGDTRALRPLGQLKLETGCGPTKQDDCFPCLRRSEDLVEALNRVSKRVAPEY